MNRKKMFYNADYVHITSIQGREQRRKGTLV